MHVVPKSLENVVVEIARVIPVKNLIRWVLQPVVLLGVDASHSYLALGLRGLPGLAHDVEFWADHVAGM